MKEYEKLKVRLSNASSLSQEYRMSMSEARDLLAEIESLMQGKEKIEQPQPVVVHEPVPITRTIDGGSL